MGSVGHGWLADRSSGGFLPIARVVTLAAPCRSEVPRQSEPVSPPPMITTCLPAADGAPSTGLPAAALFDGVRKSIAKCTPPSSRPGSASSRGTVAPVARTTASNRRRSASQVMSRPMATPGRKRVPSASICSSRRSMCDFSSLKSGMP